MIYNHFTANDPILFTSMALHSSHFHMRTGRGDVNDGGDGHACHMQT